MPEHLYLTAAEVVAMHDDQIRLHGGANGLRDRGQLESALHRPQTGYYIDLIQEAAALWESLSQNHSFVDGNKRTAITATLTFLFINGLRTTADDAPRKAFVKRHYDAGTFSFDVADTWLRENTEPLK